MVIVRGHEDT